MWKGAIQFGLVTIPVKLYLATESNYQVRFNMLHEKDLSRIQMKTFCPVDEKVISRSETVKGYEYAPDQYVVITDEDLEKVPLKTVRSIEIEQFTKAERDDTNTRFVKQAYFVEPDKIGRKAFYLLRSVLEDEGLTAICKVVIKDREALASLDPFAETMLLTTLHWPDEIRSTKELELPDEKLDFKPAEKQMARQLVAAMTGEFEPENYRDEYRDALMKVIEAKIEGHEAVAPEPVEEAGNLIDLMAALEASVKATKAARSGEAPVSVSDAKKAREKVAADSTDGTEAKKAAGARTPRKAAKSGEGEELEEAAGAGRSRRRRSA
jgi:DNA end-binding protein Ku